MEDMFIRLFTTISNDCKNSLTNICISEPSRFSARQFHHAIYCYEFFIKNLNRLVGNVIGHSIKIKKTDPRIVYIKLQIQKIELTNYYK